MKRISRILSICTCFFLAASCAHGVNPFNPQGKPDIFDPSGKLDRDDFRKFQDPDAIAKQNGEAAYGNALEPPIPDLAEILAAPKPPKIAATQLVSVAVTDDVPLRDMLIELARLADVDIEVDAGIVGGINFRAKDRPFNEVIERISDLAGLRYNVKNNVLRIERDTPYIQIYSLDLLNIDRNSNGNIGVNTSAASGSGGGGASGGGGGGGVNSGSVSNITQKAEGDFWKQFEEGIKKIIAYTPPVLVSPTTIAQQPAAPPAPVPTADGAAPAAPPPAPIPVPASTTGNNTTVTSFYILNRQASTLTVAGTERQHTILKQFINKIEANTSAQVLIEAKIIEVTLNDEYKTGINWGKIGATNARLGGNSVGFPGGTVGMPFKFGDTNLTTNVATGLFQKTNIIGGFDLQAAVQMSEVFGTTRTLSSPRLHATNNQQAVLTFAENQVYFTLKIEVADPTVVNGVTVPGKTTVTSELHTVPIGLILSLQPSINSETNEITLSVRPTLSRITGNVEDPAVKFVAASLAGASDLKSLIPVVEVREMDSILKLQSGQVMVIGGLMKNNFANTENGLPGVASVPYLGNLFKGVDKNNTQSELAIFIRATIISPHGNVDQSDKATIQKFIQDPRPIKFDPSN